MTPSHVVRWIPGIAILAFLASGGFAEEPPAPLQQGVRQLGDDDFAVREEATNRLKAAGKPAVPLLREAALSGDAEQRRRAIAILGHLLRSNDRETSLAALEALAVLAQSPDVAVRRAVEAETGAPVETVRAMAALRAIPAGMKINDGGEVTGVYFSPRVTPRVTAEHLEHLTHFPRLEKLFLSKETAEGLDVLKRLDRLQSLSLWFRRIDPEDLAPVGQLAQLRELRFYDIGFDDNNITNAALTDAALKRLEGLVNLELLQLQDTPIGDVGAQAIGRLINLRWLTLSGTKITSRGVAHLRMLKELQELKLDRTAIDDEALRHVAELEWLEVLDLSHTAITDAGLAHLKPLAVSLRTLNLSHTNVTDAGVKHLAEFSRLGGLKVTHTRVSDKGLATLGKLNRLVSLELNGTNVTDEGLKHLAWRDSLSLYIGATAITDAGLEALRRTVTELRVRPEGPRRAAVAAPPANPFEFKPVVGKRGAPGRDPFELKPAGKRAAAVEAMSRRGVIFSKGPGSGDQCSTIVFPKRWEEFPTARDLEFLKLFPEITRLVLTKRTSEGLSVLKHLPNLTSLGLHLESVEASDLEALWELREVRQLWLDGSHLGDAEIAGLPRLENLEELYLQRTKVTDQGLKIIARCPNVKSLFLDHTPVTSEGVAHLRGHAFLENLGLSYTGVDEQCLAHVFSLPKLQRLNLSGTKVAFRELPDAARNRKLTSLSLAETDVTDESLENVALFPGLRGLTLDNTKITDQGLSRLRELRNLGSLGLKDTEIGDEGLRHLSELKELNFLGLSGTRVTDAGLKHLPLRGDSHNVLWLNSTRVTDAGLKHLEPCVGLTGQLSVSETEITREAVDAFLEWRPHFRVYPFYPDGRPDPVHGFHLPAADPFP